MVWCHFDSNIWVVFIMKVTNRVKTTSKIRIDKRLARQITNSCCLCNCVIQLHCTIAFLNSAISKLYKTIIEIRFSEYFSI